jgi:hypothetical protein
MRNSRAAVRLVETISPFPLLRSKSLIGKLFYLQSGKSNLSARVTIFLSLGTIKNVSDETESDLRREEGIETYKSRASAIRFVSATRSAKKAETFPAFETLSTNSFRVETMNFDVARW